MRENNVYRYTFVINKRYSTYLYKNRKDKIMRDYFQNNLYNQEYEKSLWALYLYLREK